MANTALKAEGILREVFDRIPQGFTISLWDGTILRMGTGNRSFGLIIPSKRSFKRLFLYPNARTAGEAYIRKDIEIEGDLLEAIRLMDSLSTFKPSWGKRLNLLIRLAVL